ncbi:MAG: PEP-CTERM sorting domain-containing protein, partial [Planctomycetota bacterium]
RDITDSGGTDSGVDEWLANFGAASPAVVSAAVNTVAIPEPSTLPLLVAALGVRTRRAARRGGVPAAGAKH